MVQVSYSTYGFPGGEFEPTFEQIAEIGFECVEFIGGSPKTIS